MKRDGSDEASATQRMRAQNPLSEKVDLADIVLDNSSDLPQLTIQVKNLVKRITPSPTTWLLEYLAPPVLLAAAIFAAVRYFNGAITRS
jgi:dephospho-CoA kinase